MVKRGAFSLIELVLAIVVIAISIMTIPLMLNQNSKAISFTIMQESMMAARTKIENILSYQWDSCSTIASGVAGTETRIKVIDVLNGDLELNRTVNTIRRVGHVREDLRRRFHDLGVGVLALPSGDGLSATKVSIDSFNGETISMNAGGSLDYLRDFNITTAIFYISDEVNYTSQNINFNFDATAWRSSTVNVNQSTNIKMIELNVTTQDAQPFILRAFSSNIGQTELLRRSF